MTDTDFESRKQQLTNRLNAHAERVAALPFGRERSHAEMIILSVRLVLQNDDDIIVKDLLDMFDDLTTQIN